MSDLSKLYKEKINADTYPVHKGLSFEAARSRVEGVKWERNRTAKIDEAVAELLDKVELAQSLMLAFRPAECLGVLETALENFRKELDNE